MSDWTDAAEGSFFVAQGGGKAAVKPLNAMGNLPSRLNVIRSIHTYAQILSCKEIDVLTLNRYRAEKKSLYVVARLLHTS